MRNRGIITWRVLIAFVIGLLPKLAEANPVDWVMIETRLVPQTCSKPLECMPKSSLVLRNMAFLEPTETRELTLFLNRIATIRGISDVMIDSLNYSQAPLVERFHKVALSEKSAFLRHHPGVYFESTKLDETPETEAFSDYVRTNLLAAGVPLLSKEEHDKTPGRPKLTIRYSKHRESAGCIIPFSLTLSITEEVVLVRSPGLKTTTTIWSGTVRENLANRNYSLTSGIRELVDKFLEDWRAAQAT